MRALPEMSWRRTGSALVLLFLAAGAGAAAAPLAGPEPTAGAASRFDVDTAPGNDAAGRALAAQAATLQSGRRVVELRLDLNAARRAWAGADATLARAALRLDARPAGPALRFDGRLASQLNSALLAAGGRRLEVRSASIEIDEPIVVRRPRTWLDLGRAGVGTRATAAPPFLLRVENVAGATIEGGVFAGGRSAVLVRGAVDAALIGGRYSGQRAGAIVVTGSARPLVQGATITGSGGAAILVHGDTSDAALLDNRIEAGVGSSNWHAGIVLSDRRPADAGAAFSLLLGDGRSVVEQPITERLRPPRRSVVAGNRIARNASSGIYSDGAVESVIVDNVVEGNSKEGVCLDNGSAANVVAGNQIRSNGQRWGKSDAELALDFVGVHGRLPDGSAAAKTPGISIDNALFNIVHGNRVQGNYGGGVKMVRTAFFNLVSSNIVTDNNVGASDRFHFFGIELGAARADVPVRDLDFAPSRGNAVIGNIVEGSHYAGIFLAAGSSGNRLSNNLIRGPLHWSFEQVVVQDNPSRDNLADRPSRNFGNEAPPGNGRR